jgi:hypothetical protein
MEDNLNPEISTWECVVAQAEIIEISENVAERRDRRVGPPQASGSGEGSSKPKHQHQTPGRAARAVTFDSPKRRHGHDRQRSRTRGNQGTRGESHTSTSSHHHTHQPPSSNDRRDSSKKEFNRGKSQSSTSQKTDQQKLPWRSDKELAEFRASGKCFSCGKEGHISRNCPDSQTVHSHGSKPPGRAAFNIEPVVFEEDVLDDVEVLDSLPLGAIRFDDDLPPECLWPIDEWCEHYPYWCEPNILARSELGDCYSIVAGTVLTLDQPYPGDEYFDTDLIRPELRFKLTYQENTCMYQIHDRLVEAKELVSRAFLEQPKFNISCWYAARRIQSLDLKMGLPQGYAMGHAIRLVAAKLLTDGIPSAYPCTRPDLDPGDRFKIYPLRADQDNYTIRDADLDILVEVPKSSLENPVFDLVSWYVQHLETWQLVEQRYKELHINSYLVDLPPHTPPHMDYLEIDFDYPESIPGEDDPIYDDLPGLNPVSDSEDGKDDEPEESSQDRPTEGLSNDVLNEQGGGSSRGG